MSERPVHLYKYQRVDARTLENLKLRTLWFSAPSAFNDPFDCAVDVVLKELSSDDIERAWGYVRSLGNMAPGLEAELSTDGKPNERFRETIVRGVKGVLNLGGAVDEKLRQVGIACLTSKPDDLLMWSHYADGHRGFCLEFSTSAEPFTRAVAVDYVESIPSVNPLDVLDGKKTGPDLLGVMLWTKASCWQYECEWRVLHEQAGTAYRYPFRALTGVYLGASMPSGQKDMIGQLLHGSPIQLYEMNRGTGGFSVEATPITYTPFDFGSDDAE